jgi:hypothetical protein
MRWRRSGRPSDLVRGLPVLGSSLEQLCDPGGVLVSGTVYHELRGRTDLEVVYVSTSLTPPREGLRPKVGPYIRVMTTRRLASLRTPSPVGTARSLSPWPSVLIRSAYTPEMSAFLTVSVRLCDRRWL